MLCCSPLSSGINHTSLFRRDVFQVGIGGEAGLTHQIGDNRQAVVRMPLPPEEATALPGATRAGDLLVGPI